MTPLVVDLLEVVEIEQHERERRSRPRSLRKHPLQAVCDGALVGETGEPVGCCPNLGDCEVAQVGKPGAACRLIRGSADFSCSSNGA